MYINKLHRHVTLVSSVAQPALRTMTMYSRLKYTRRQALEQRRRSSALFSDVKVNKETIAGKARIAAAVPLSLCNTTILHL